MNDDTRRKVGLFTAVMYYHFLFVYLLVPHRHTVLVYGTILVGIVSVVANCFARYRMTYQRILQWFHRLSVIVQLNVLVELEYPHPYASKINLLFMLIAVGDVVRYSLVARLNENFISESRLGWYRDIIRLERTLLKAKHGDGYELSDAALLELIRRSTRRLGAKAYFCMLCNDAETAQLAPRFEVLDIIQDNIRQAALYGGTASGSDVQDARGGPGAEPATDIYEKIQQDLIGTPRRRAGDAEEDAPVNSTVPCGSPGYAALSLESATGAARSRRLIDLRYLSAQDQKWLTENNNFLRMYRSEKRGCLRVELDAYRGLRKIDKIQLKGAVTLESLIQVMPAGDANACFRILTQRFESSLSFADFEGSMRQLNNLRSCLISTLQNNQRTMDLLGSTFFAIELVLIFFLLYVILDFGVVAKLVASMCLFLSPLLWSIFDSFIFLVVAHPYDIGDRVFIDGENLIVRDIGLTCTIFEKWNNECVVIANTHIRTKIIKNIRRSKNQQWLVSFYLSAETPAERLGALRANLKAFVAKNPAFEHITVTFDEIRDCSFYKMSFIVKHAINHQNGFFMWKVQNKFMARLVSECNANGIAYCMPEISLA